MEHPLDNNIIRAIDVKKLDDAGLQMIQLAQESLDKAESFPCGSTTAFCHARDALEYVMQAHAYGKNVAYLILRCREALDNCVGAQIEDAVRAHLDFREELDLLDTGESF